MRFENREKFRDAVAKYAIIQGRNLTFAVSAKCRQQRLGVKCLGGCPFKLYGSWDSRRACFVVKSVDDMHDCNRNMEANTQMKSTRVARQFLEVFKSRPHWPAPEIVETVRRAYKVIIARSFAYKIKYHAHRMLHGSMKEHYNKLGSYLEALKLSNPKSVFLLVTDPSRQVNPPIFQRFFVSFDALSKGWLSGCRRIVCVDGCFLKTFLGGMLLAAVGRDANEQMYPIAWAVVEGENNDAWEWFMLQLRDCLGEKNRGENWTFISDQQKGILSAVASVFSKAEHRNCARHVYANWHKVFKGDELKGLFWRAARAYNEADHDDAIQEMEQVNPVDVLAFKAQNTKSFCRAFVKTHTKTDVIVNNMAETFNGYIIHARTKHVMHMLEDISTALMQRLYAKRKEVEKGSSLLCPRIQAKLDKEKEEVGNCSPLPSTAMVFQVVHRLDSLTVDLEAKSCTCRKWQLTGIPCCHALICIYFKHEQAEGYVVECFRRQTWLQCYDGAIQPVVGERHRPKVDLPIDPPPIKIGPRRPRRNKRKDPHENPKKPGRLKKHGTELSCSVCKSKTHTKRKCPDKDKVMEPQPKRGRGRPRKFPLNSSSRETSAATGPSSTTVHHTATAQPSRTGRRGQVINTTRGGREGRGSRGGRGGKHHIPAGLGTYIDENGHAFINPGHVGLISTQASTSNAS